MKIPMGGPRRRSPLAALALLLTLMVTLSGCVRLQRDVTLNNDGSGTYSFAFGFSDKLIAIAGSTFSAQMGACGESVKVAGGSYSMVDTGGYSAWTFSWHFTSLSRLNSLLAANATFCTLTNTNVPSSATTNDAFDVAAHGHFLTTTYVLTGHLSFVLQADDTSLDPNTKALLQQAYSSFAITMPGWVSGHTSGGVVDGSTVTYTAHNGDTLDFQVVGEGLNVSALLAVGGGVALLVGLLALIAWIFRRPDTEEGEGTEDEALVAPRGYAD